MARPSRDSYFTQIACVVATRSTCVRRQVGAVLVSGTQIISTGYNGSPQGLAHCEEIGCLRKKMNIPSGERQELCRGAHAEQNAIVQAAAHGISTKDSVLFCTHHPCSTCAKMIINAGVKRIVYIEGYPDQLSEELFKEARIPVEKFNQ